MLKVVLAPLVTYILQLPPLPETSGGIEGKAGNTCSSVHKPFTSQIP